MELNLFDETYLQDKIAFHFGGFYHSIHSDVIDSHVDHEADFLGIEEGTQEYNDFYKTLDFEATCKNYLDSMIEVIDKKLKTNLKECFVEMVSPKYYNYSTDYILLDKTKLNEQLKKFINQDFNNEHNDLHAFFDDVYNFTELELELEYLQN